MLNREMKKLCLAVLFFSFTLNFPRVAVGMTAAQFFQLALKHPEINAFAVTCQSAHETGWWRSRLWGIANNGAGIKVDASRQRKGLPSVAQQSPEMVGRQKVYRVSYFRSYRNPEEFLRDYRNKIVRDYPYSVLHRDVVWGYFAGLEKGRRGAWATNHTYYQHLVDKAFQLAPSLLGVEWRAKLLADYHEAKRRQLLKPTYDEMIRKRLIASGVVVVEKKL